MLKIHPVLQRYAWGDHEALPRLLGQQPDGTPWAELWYGTHPAGPATVDGGGALSERTGELPYLVKLLAAAEPLSLQTHPTAERARAGHAEEEARGLARDDPQRVYRDPNSKPEMICALGRFEALCGLRDPHQTHAWFLAQGWDELAGAIAGGDAHRYLEITLSTPDLLLPESLPAWAADLSRRHPGHRGAVAAALALNHVVLRPGEALALEAGNLHMYLHGVGVEAMGPSDNVVRGAFTPKHVDVAEVLRVVDVSPLHDPIVRPQQAAPGVWSYPPVASSFQLSRYEVDGSAVVPPSDGPQLLLCTHGSTDSLSPGEAAVVAAGEAAELQGTATVWCCRAVAPA